MTFNFMKFIFCLMFFSFSFPNCSCGDRNRRYFIGNGMHTIETGNGSSNLTATGGLVFFAKNLDIEKNSTFDDREKLIEVVVKINDHEAEDNADSFFNTDMKIKEVINYLKLSAINLMVYHENGWIYIGDNDLGKAISTYADANQKVLFKATGYEPRAANSDEYPPIFYETFNDGAVKSEDSVHSKAYSGPNSVRITFLTKLTPSFNPITKMYVFGGMEALGLVSLNQNSSRVLQVYVNNSWVDVQIGKKISDYPSASFRIIDNGSNGGNNVHSQTFSQNNHIFNQRLPRNAITDNHPFFTTQTLNPPDPRNPYFNTRQNPNIRHKKITITFQFPSEKVSVNIAHDATIGYLKTILEKESLSPEMIKSVRNWNQGLHQKKLANCGIIGDQTIKITNISKPKKKKPKKDFLIIAGIVAAIGTVGATIIHRIFEENTRKLEKELWEIIQYAIVKLSFDIYKKFPASQLAKKLIIEANKQGYTKLAKELKQKREKFIQERWKSSFSAFAGAVASIVAIGAGVRSVRG